MQKERRSNKAQQVPAHEQVSNAVLICLLYKALCIMVCWVLTPWQHADVQMQFQSRKADLGLFKERAGALEQAVVILEEGISASRAQVIPKGPVFSMIVRYTGEPGDT